MRTSTSMRWAAPWQARAASELEDEEELSIRSVNG